MSVLDTNTLELSPDRLDPWIGKIQAGSVIATLSTPVPQRFGAGEAMIFDIGEAEYVGEGQQKGAADVTAKTQKVEPFKFHKTVRFNQEVLWADEDRQLAVVDQILAQIQPALSRALDFGVIHGVNPASGQAVPAMTQKLADATNVVTAGSSDKPYANLDAADALVLAAGYVPSGVALDPVFASRFASLRATQTEQKLYPGLKLSTEVGELDGHKSAVSRTVGGKGVITPDTGLLGIVGDFDAVRWGVQRELGLELIEYGDPDGQGDLKRNNQVAFRAEVVYGWGIADKDAFALVKAGA